ncbi:AraC family transcriptional regulator [Ralstonia pseudosolanacearum]|uniref:AraC family transcriptional regulator n=1 Tax=Ralstonia pseudosolanacearum TaxID=1310165 RepID=UPI002E1E5005
MSHHGATSFQQDRCPRNRGNSRRRPVSGPGIVLGRTSVGLLAAFDRLVGLLDEPDLIPVLGPLAQREIFYRVLNSDAGSHLWSPRYTQVRKAVRLKGWRPI